MDFPAFLKANGIADDPERRAKVEGQVPMKRLGGMDEFAHACAPFLDGTSRFTTGQFLGYAGGWAVMELELVEPSLFLSYDEVAPVLLAQASKRRSINATTSLPPGGASTNRS